MRPIFRNSIPRTFTPSVQQRPLWVRSTLSLVCLWPLMAAHAQQASLDAGTLQRNFENQLPSSSPLGLKAPAPKLQQDPVSQNGEAIVTVSRFEWLGVQRFEPEELRQLLIPYLNKPLTLNDLQQVCGVVERRYRERGFLAQVTVPPQTVQGGVLNLQVLEAKLGQVFIDTPDGVSRFGAERAARYIAWANPNGQELNLNHITRALIVLNEIPGVAVTSAMEPGDADGETNLRLKLKDNAEHFVSIGVNNQGSRSTGVAQLNAQVTFNNPLGYGDQLAVSGIDSQGSSYIQAGYFLPLLPNGLRAGVSASALNYRNVPAFQENGGYGEADTLSASLAYPLLRSDEANANATVRYERKTYSNYLIATDAISSSYHIQNINLGLAGSLADDLGRGANNSGQVSLQIGRLQLQSDNPSNYGTHTPSRFLKITFAGNRLQTLVPGVSRILLSMTGQLANENLNSSEQFFLGGPYGVRAYPMAQGGGSQGIQATLEYQHTLREGLQGIMFLDTGRVQQYVHTYDNWQGSTHAGNWYSLSGAGFGLKWSAMGVNLSATVAWKLGSNPLYNQQGQAVDVDNQSNHMRGWLTANYNF